MAALQQMETWSARHNPKWLVVLRAGLGLCLFIKGIQFIYNSVFLNEIFSGSAFLARVAWLGTVIPYVHLLGGALIIVGLFTRLACLVQIPVLLGAVFFVNLKQGFLSGGTDLPFSVIVLLFLFFFFLEGGGSISLDHRYFHDDKKTG